MPAPDPSGLYIEEHEGGGFSFICEIWWHGNREARPGVMVGRGILPNAGVLLRASRALCARIGGSVSESDQEGQERLRDRERAQDDHREVDNAGIAHASSRLQLTPKVCANLMGSSRGCH